MQAILRAGVDPKQIDSLDLDYGDLLVKIEKIKGGSTFDVNTPTAVAGVRGTGWGVSTKREEEESDISCYKGKIYVKIFDEVGRLIAEIDVDVGYTTHVEKGQAPTAAVPVSEKEKHEEWEGEVTKYKKGKRRKLRKWI